MIKTGITKYDQLPHVVGSIDVNSLRQGYVEIKGKLDKLLLKLDHIESELDKVAGSFKYLDQPQTEQKPTPLTQGITLNGSTNRENPNDH